MSPTLFWTAATVVFAVVEGATVGLVSIWFALGALAALAVSFFTGSLLVQAVVFLVVSFAALVGMKPLADKYLNKKGYQPTNADRIVGREGVVQEEIDNLDSRGRVKVLGQEWSARSTSGEKIPPQTVVVIDRIEGVKVFVSPKETQ